jgi:hypothetical protein
MIVERSLILWPMIVQAGLTFAVAIRMYLVRIAEMRARRISPDSIATSRAAAERLENTSAADNYRNLFELPVLFYAICLALYVTDLVTPVQLALGWTFCGLRIAHSLVHVTYNRVMDRFRVFILGMICVFAMWALFAVQLAG